MGIRQSEVDLPSESAQKRRIHGVFPVRGSDEQQVLHLLDSIQFLQEDSRHPSGGLVRFLPVHSYFVDLIDHRDDPSILLGRFSCQFEYPIKISFRFSIPFCHQFSDRDVDEGVSQIFSDDFRLRGLSGSWRSLEQCGIRDHILHIREIFACNRPILFSLFPRVDDVDSNPLLYVVVSYESFQLIKLLKRFPFFRRILFKYEHSHLSQRSQSALLFDRAFAQ